jgi:hypothetical protein
MTMPRPDIGILPLVFTQLFHFISTFFFFENDDEFLDKFGKTYRCASAKETCYSSVIDICIRFRKAHKSSIEERSFPPSNKATALSRSIALDECMCGLYFAAAFLRSVSDVANKPPHVR